MIPNISVSVMALPKQGKTHIACSFPDPIALFSFDLGAKFVCNKFADKIIKVYEYPIPIVDTAKPQPFAEDLYQKVKKDYLEACTSGEFKTIVIDPATVLWEIVRHAYIDELGRKNIKEVEYAEPNSRMSWFLMQPMVSGINLVILSHLRDRYEGGVSTGEKELDGFKRINNIADVVVLLERRKKQFYSKIVDCRFEPQLSDEEFENFTYADLIAVLGWTEEKNK